MKDQVQTACWGIQWALPLLLFVSGPLPSLLMHIPPPALQENWNKCGDTLFPFFDRGCIDEKRFIEGVLVMSTIAMITGFGSREIGYGTITFLYGRSAFIHCFLEDEPWKYWFSGFISTIACVLLLRELEFDLERLGQKSKDIIAPILEIISTSKI